MPDDPYEGMTGGGQPLRPLHLVDPRTLRGVAIPPREWIVDDWLPVGHVTLFYGDGGTGKTLLAQQLMTACATGTPWIGHAVHQCRTMALFCEDDQAEVHRRQDRINAAGGLGWEDLADMRWACAVGEDNTLVRFDRDGCPELMPRFMEVSRLAKQFGARLLILDTAADLFAGNENSRAEVRTFLGPVLTKLAREINAAVLVNAHPSRSGMSSSGDMDGGSTAWSNTARSRWALTRPVDEDDQPADDAVRILSRRKANYSSIGTEIELHWQDGVLVNPRQPSSFETVGRHSAAEAMFITLLERLEQQRRFVSSSKNAANFAPKIMGKERDRGGFGRRDFETAMASMFAAGRIVNVSYGRKSDERYRLALAPEAAGSGTPDTTVTDWQAACEEAGYGK